MQLIDIKMSFEDVNVIITSILSYKRVGHWLGTTNSKYLLVMVPTRHAI